MRMLQRIASFLAVVAFAFPATAGALTLSFVPADQTRTLGDPATVDVVLSGLADAGEVVASFDIDVSYDPSIVGDPTVGFTAESAMGGGSFVLFDVQYGAGFVDFAASSFLFDSELEGLQLEDSLTLVTLTFPTIGVGTTPLAFDLVTPNMIIGRDSFQLDVGVTGGSITVTGTEPPPIPEPTTMLLLGSGLAGLAAHARRRK